MHFTVVFSSHESVDLAYSLVFVPAPVWVTGERKVLNVSSEGPRYRKGSVRRLLAKEGIVSRLLEDTRDSVIVVQPSGHGTEEDLRSLEADLRHEDFNVHKFFFATDHTP